MTLSPIREASFIGEQSCSCSRTQGQVRSVYTTARPGRTVTGGPWTTVRHAGAGMVCPSASRSTVPLCRDVVGSVHRKDHAVRCAKVHLYVWIHRNKLADTI